MPSLRASLASQSKYCFCSMHSPALSQIGQSIGWLTRVNSSIWRRTSSARGERVITSILSATGV